METEDIIELDLESIAQGGDAVGRHNGWVVFARGGLPGERVRVRLYERTARYGRGIVVEVLHAAAERVDERLPQADHMPWQHIAYDAQLRFKQQIVREQLARLGGIAEADSLVRTVVPSAAIWNYRTTAHLHVAARGRYIGYHMAGSHIVRDIAQDPLLLPPLNTALAALRAVIASDTPAMSSNRALERVTLRASTSEGTVVARLKGRGNLRLLAQHWQAAAPLLKGCATGARGEAAVALREQLGGITFVLAPETFFQVQTAQAETLLALVRSALALPDAAETTGGDDYPLRLLDAYSGAGTFALPLARALAPHGEVVAVEEQARAVADGERSAQHNGVEHVRFLCAAVEHALPAMVAENARFDAVLLDPPRSGCNPAALEALLALAPPRIVFISCHPGVLARDLRLLLDGGYRLAWVQPVDMFPQTPHVESVALLLRG